MYRLYLIHFIASLFLSHHLAVFLFAAARWEADKTQKDV